MLSLLAAGPAFAAVTTFPVGPSPSAAAPVAVAVDSTLNRAFVVHRDTFVDVAVNVGLVPSDSVSAVDLATGNVLARIPVGAAGNGLYQAIAVDSTRQRAWVTNASDHTVTVINTSTHAVVATVPVGLEPHGVAADPERGLVFVANTGANRLGSITVLDAATNAVRGTVALDAPAVHLAVDRSTGILYATLDAAPWAVVAINGSTRTVLSRVGLNLLFGANAIAVQAGSRVYVSFSTTKAIAVVDCSNPAALRESTRWLSVGVTPRGLAVDASGSVYVVDSSNENLTIWNSSGTQTKSLDLLRMPTAACFDSATSRVYVANTQSNSLTAINTATQTVVGHLPIATAATGIAFDPVGQRIYATNFLTDTISVVNPTTRAVIATYRPGPSPWAVAVDGNLRQLYSLNSAGAGTLSVLSTTDGRILRTVTVGRPTQVVTVSPGTRRVFATAGENLTVLDGNTLNVLATVPLTGRPVGIALDEANNRLYVACQQAGTIVVLNATTYAVTATWRPPLNNVWGLAIDVPLRRLYVAIIKNTIADFGGVEVLNADTGAFVAQIATGAELVAVNSRTHTVYATDIGGNALSVIDGNTNALAPAIPIGVAPRDLTVDEATGFVYVANAADGTVSIVDAAVTATAPVITAQPQNQTVNAGANVSFGVTASGTAPLSYQWRRDGVNITGATTASLSLTGVQAGQAGAYSVVVTNRVSSVTSNNATLTVVAPSATIAPSISAHPQSQTATAGSSVTLSVTAAGTAPLTYQWLKDGTAIAGATGSTLILANAQTASAGSYAVTIANSAGSVTSSSAVLTIATTTVPTVVVQPRSQSVAAGGTVTFTFGGSGTAPLTYQWFKDGVALAGANGATLTLTNVQAIHAGSYTVVCTNNFGSVTSDAAVLTLAVAVPTIAAPPRSQTVVAGASVTFAVTAVSTGAITYQWVKNGTPIAGATGATLTLPSVQPADAGSYAVVCTTSAGSVTSAAATLVVETAPSRIVNISIRSAAGRGAQTLIVGFVVSGTNQAVLVRGIGPALRGFGVTGVLADPTLAIYGGSTLVAENDDWSTAANAPQVAAAAAALGAFALPSGSLDAALLLNVNGGGYTAQMAGIGTSTGIALVELYDASPPGAARLVNASARTHVGTGENILIAGFAIGGTSRKTLLLRAVGPALVSLGVADALLDPQLQLYRAGASAVIAANDDWDGAPALRAAFTQVGAFALNSSSFDAALLVTLDPGSYTAHVSGFEGETGVALLEIYEVN